MMDLLRDREKDLLPDELRVRCLLRGLRLGEPDLVPCAIMPIARKMRIHEVNNGNRKAMACSHGIKTMLVTVWINLILFSTGCDLVKCVKQGFLGLAFPRTQALNCLGACGLTMAKYLIWQLGTGSQSRYKVLKCNDLLIHLSHAVG